MNVPHDWQDVSLLVLSSPDDHNGSSFTLSRDTLPWGLDFTQFAEREIHSLSQKLKNYQAIAQETGELNGMTTITSEFTWTSPQGPLHQLMTMLHLPAQILILTGTCAGAMTPVQREQMRTMMTSFQPRPHDSE
ncbi:DcrB-related protein [Photorhabdus temperata]|uniref:DcrB-related protein n=1 Tax=Photorhabdus temperata TaxID=574560 RepID=UPI001E36A681|nr:DcrB-related protein [Photorhabdus temperata]